MTPTVVVIITMVMLRKKSYFKLFNTRINTKSHFCEFVVVASSNPEDIEYLLCSQVCHDSVSMTVADDRSLLTSLTLPIELHRAALLMRRIPLRLNLPCYDLPIASIAFIH